MQVLGKEKKKRENTHTMLPGRQQEKETKKDGLSDASVLLPRGNPATVERSVVPQERGESPAEKTPSLGSHVMYRISARSA